MKNLNLQTVKNRKNEKGAAMVMVLLVSFLLLTASIGFLLAATMNTANISDATAEQQAYAAAESGLQASINVLRGNAQPSVLLDPTKSATHPDNRITYRRAVTPGTSNLAGDTGTNARMSRWMPYDYAPNGLNDSARVTMGFLPGGYTPQTGFAYNISVTDPDATNSIIGYEAVGQFLDPADGVYKSFVSIPDEISLLYIAPARQTLNVSSGLSNAQFGTITVLRLGLGTVTLTKDIRFQIHVQMKAPYDTTRTMYGWIKKGQSVSNGGTVVLDFDSPAYDLMGSILTLNNDPMTANIGLASNTVNGTMTNAEPFRLIVRSVGYGPRGAKKELEATLQRNFFNGLSAPATLTMVGPQNGFVFEPGTSNVVEYSGDDIATNRLIPPIGTTNTANLSIVAQYTKDGHKLSDQITGTPSNVSSEIPFWLQSPQNLDETLLRLRRTAEASKRVFTNGRVPGNSDFGNNATATGITYIEGNADLRGNGGGILVCTGTLTLRGAFDFNGLIIVTGAGGINRSGGGNGLLQGNTVIAPYNPANLTAGFLAPKYDISGGGNSTIRFNSNSVANGMTAVSNIVLGVAEK